MLFDLPPSLSYHHPVPLWLHVSILQFVSTPSPIFLSPIFFPSFPCILLLYILSPCTPPNPSLLLLHAFNLNSSFLLCKSKQGKGISKSVSMNCGPCQGEALGTKTLSHSDSYTWAVENRRSSSARDGSISSHGSQELSFSDIYPDNYVPTESQVYKNSHDKREVIQE